MHRLHESVLDNLKLCFLLGVVVHRKASIPYGVTGIVFRILLLEKLISDW